MERKLLLSETVSVIGLVFGVSGFVLGVLNYLRDRYKITVHLCWDMAMSSNYEYDKEKLCGLITVTNIGRRPSYVSHAAPLLPKEYEHSHLLIYDSTFGKTLPEGASPVSFIVNQDDVKQYAKDWQKIVAQVSDSTGKVWYSKKLKKDQIPSWAKESND